MRSVPLTRREFIRLVGAGSAAFALGNKLLAVDAGEGSRPPNVVLILADDLGYGELGCQGNKEIPTPNIDSIAANGTRFTNGYVSCPVCSPTRAGLMTGRYQERFGHEFNPGTVPSGVEFGLPLTETTLAARLKAAGYATGIVGKWHLGYEPKYMPLNRGFDEFFGFLGGAHPYTNLTIPAGDKKNAIRRGNEPVEEKEYLTDAFAREAISFINRHKEKPFFLYLPFNAVHSPLQAPQKYLDRFPSITDQKRKTFAAMLPAMDDAVGGVLRTLRSSGLEDNTLIFFISDNGGPTPSTTSSNVPLRGFKGQVYEGGFRVPFMVQWKGHVPAGKVSDKPVISLDVAPTVLAAVGAKAADAKFDGVDIMPFIEGQGTPHDVLYWRFGQQHAVRKGNWKLLKSPEGNVELYDLSADVGEKNDLSQKNPEKVKELQAVFDAWDAQLAKPLWPGGRARRSAAGARRNRPAGARRKRKQRT